MNYMPRRTSRDQAFVVLNVRFQRTEEGSRVSDLPEEFLSLKVMFVSRKNTTDYMEPAFSVNLDKILWDKENAEHFVVV